MAARRARLIMLLICVTAGASGCRAVGSNSLFRQGSANAVAPSVTVDEAVAAINENARSIQDIKARATITASIGGRKHFAFPLKGDMLMERERNFRLALRTNMMGDVADIGSNDQGFWFWVKDNDNAIYTCKYDANGQIPARVPVTMQPDWIIEALGLREISESAASRMQIRRGQKPDPQDRISPTVVLYGPLESSSGAMLQRVIVLNANTKRIVDYALIAPNGQDMVAQATPKYELSGRIKGATGIPNGVILKWARERIELDVALNNIEINQGFDEKRRALAFAEPDMPGFERRDLAAMAAGSGYTGQTQIRESRPVPPPGGRGFVDDAASRVRLGQPASVGVDGTANPRSNTRALDSLLPPLPPPSNDLIQSPIPTAP
jgi:hypothetical protein